MLRSACIVISGSRHAVTCARVMFNAEFHALSSASFAWPRICLSTKFIAGNPEKNIFFCTGLTTRNLNLCLLCSVGSRLACTLELVMFNSEFHELSGDSFALLQLCRSTKLAEWNFQQVIPCKIFLVFQDYLEGTSDPDMPLHELWSCSMQNFTLYLALVSVGRDYVGERS